MGWALRKGKQVHFLVGESCKEITCQSRVIHVAFNFFFPCITGGELLLLFLTSALIYFLSPQCFLLLKAYRVYPCARACRSPVIARVINILGVADLRYYAAIFQAIIGRCVCIFNGRLDMHGNAP